MQINLSAAGPVEQAQMERAQVHVNASFANAAAAGDIPALQKFSDSPAVQSADAEIAAKEMIGFCDDGKQNNKIKPSEAIVNEAFEDAVLRCDEPVVLELIDKKYLNVDTINELIDRLKGSKAHQDIIKKIKRACPML